MNRVSKKRSYNSGYQKYLDNIRSKQETPDEVVRDIIKKATGRNLNSKKRIVAGEVNEVYEVITDKNNRFIVRISLDASNSFLQERWAIEESKRVGVPVPEILLIGNVAVKGSGREFCVTSYIEGRVLGRGLLDFDLLNKAEQREYIHQAGEILSKIHSIKTSGFGKINATGVSQYATVDDSFFKWENKEFYEGLARQVGLGLGMIKDLKKTLIAFKAIYKQVEPRLNHGDYFRKHFVVRNKKIVGILDWAEVRSDSPIYDFANWEFWIENPNYLNWLKEGYADKSLFNNHFENFSHVIRLMIGMEVLDWYQSQKYQKVVEQTKMKLINDLNFLKNKQEL